MSTKTRPLPKFATTRNCMRSCRRLHQNKLSSHLGVPHPSRPWRGWGFLLFEAAGCRAVLTEFAIDSVTSMRVENRPGHLFGGCRLRVLGFPAHGGGDTGAAAGMVVKNEL